MDMPRPRPIHLQRRLSRHGKVTWYVRVKRGPLIRIREPYGSPSFDAAYQAALRGERTFKRPGIKGGTLGWLVAEYQKATAWTNLSPATHKQRKAILKHVLAAAGDDPISWTDRTAIVEGRDRRAATPFQARHFIDTMRGIFKWAVDARLVSSDPTEGVKIKKPKTKGFLVWTEEDIEKFEARWVSGTRQRVMFDVYCYTGLRRGDAARVGPQHIIDGVINIHTQKGGEMMLVSIPLLDCLRDSLALGPTGTESFIVTTEGRPYVKESLGTVFAKACKEAGLVNKSAHGLRKAAATRAADNGASEKELEAIFGWEGGRMASLYTRSANRKRLAKGAMSKLERTSP